MINIDFSKMPKVDGTFAAFALSLLGAYAIHEVTSNGYSLSNGDTNLVPGDKRKKLTEED